MGTRCVNGCARIIDSMTEPANSYGRFFVRATEKPGLYIVAGVVLIPDGRELPGESIVDATGTHTQRGALDVMGAMFGGDLIANEGKLTLTIDLGEASHQYERFAGCDIDHVLTSGIFRE